jgi:uncharacterized protein
VKEVTALVGTPSIQLRSFYARTFEIAGTAVVADQSGALYVPGERTLVVADLHLEKGSASAARGIMLPPYDSRETLRRLAGVVARYSPQCIVALGDSLHDRSAESRLGSAERAEVFHLQTGRDWLWITGNHDPVISAGLGGAVAASLHLGAIILRHDPTPGDAPGEIAGHLHPAARIVLGATGMRRPCFVGDGTRLVMPAFGAFTGGLNVLDEAFASLFSDYRFDVHVLGQNGVYPVPRPSLRAD